MPDTTTATAPADTTTDSAYVDVGVTLGELRGRTVVVAAFVTDGITAQLQLPPDGAAQAGLSMMLAAQAAGVDVAALLMQLAADSAGGIEVPGVDVTALITRAGG